MSIKPADINSNLNGYRSRDLPIQSKIGDDTLFAS